MTAAFDEAWLRGWLVDYLVTNLGCSPDQVDVDASFSDVGVGSRDSVVLSGELSELLGRPVSPVEFWQHPSIGALAAFLTGSESDGDAGVVSAAAAVVDEPVAVIGLGCRFAGDIAGPESLWRFLSERRSAVTQVPADRWSWFDDGSAGVAAALAATTRWGAFLSDVDAFDAEFFEISPREAVKMDPQQRLLLEVTHEALEHAGIPVSALRHSLTGVFAGACAGEYGFLASADLSQVDAWSGTGGALSIIANRLSYVWDLRGPSVTVDTACSSSLVAVHLACQSLRTGDADLAIAAGANVVLSPAITRSFDQANAMSPTGECHAFDAAADGFVRGEGAGVVVLKRLSDALRDGDRVWALVRGSAVNQDGHSNGLMAPNPAAQMAVLRAAYANAGISPRDVDYVEAHGTGTLLGDPIEARALGTVLGRGRAPGAPLLVGAVKTNLGHLEAAAGIAGFIKTVLALQRGRIPANRGFTNPNPLIPFDGLGLEVVAEHTDWPAVHRPRRAGVSSFGFGGTNAHVVLEQGPDRMPVAVDGPTSAVTTLMVSGKTPERVAASASVLAEWIQGEGAGVGLADVAHTLAHHRSRYAKSATVCARDRDAAVAGLRALAAGQTAPGVVEVGDGPTGPGVVFVYSGQGSQWAGMGRQLLVDEPVFAAAVAELEPVFVAQTGFSLHEVLAGGDAVVGIERIQPVLVGLQLALTALWRHYGVQPDAVIGHSMGEVAAAVVAGALSPADGLAVIATRSRLMSRLSGQGAMALLELDAPATEALIAGHPDVALAVYASRRQTVIAGPPHVVDALIEQVQAQDRLARRVDVDVASHHRTVDPILPELRSALVGLSPQHPGIPLLSTVEPGGQPVCDADYWVANLRWPVRFSQAVAAAAEDYATFIEISPHPLLTHAITESTRAVRQGIPTLQRDTDDTLTFHTNLNRTHIVEPAAADHPPEPHPVIPTTPWEHTRHWATAKKRANGAASAPVSGTLLGEHTAVATNPSMHLWQAQLIPDAKPYPGSHRIHGVEVVPVSVLLQTILAAAAQSNGSALSGVRFQHPIVIDQPRVIQVVADDESVTVSSRPAADAPGEAWTRHVSAALSPPMSRLGEEHQAPIGVPGDAISVSDDLQHPFVGAESRSLPELFEAWGVEGQPFPWSVDALRCSSAGAVAEITLGEASTVALLDAAVHVASLLDAANPRLLVPATLDSVRLGEPLTDARGSVEIRRRGGRGDDLTVDIDVKAPDGRICLDIRALRYADIESGPAQPGGADPRTIAHAIEWRTWHPEAGDRAAPPGPRTVAVLGATAKADLAQCLANLGYLTAGVADARYVVYLADPVPGDADLDRAVRLSAEVCDLIRLLATRDDDHPATLWIVTRGVYEADSDAALPQSTLWGLARVIAAERPEFWGGLVDIGAETDTSDWLPALCGVLGVPAGRIVALRGGEFLAPALAPISGEPVRESLRCRPDAAYLITGGLGALGMRMATWLADRGARRLVLAGRTALPPRRDWEGAGMDSDLSHKIAAIRALEMRGVSVDVVALDVGSRDAMQALLAKWDRRGAPPIRGVIHAAGVAESRLLTDTSDGALGRVMWSKVAGSQALHEAFPPGHLDFLFLIASAGTFFGIPGQGAYAAANAYLDCLARVRRRHGCHSVSLDWVAWEGLGFAADADIVVDELRRLGSRPVAPDEAFAAWDYVHTHDVAHAVMAPMPSPGQTGAATLPAPVRTWSAMDPDDLLSELQTGLRAIVARELQMPEAEVQSDRPFAELGLNSVMAMSIRREAEQLVGIELSATMLWNHPTIASLAAYLAKRLLPRSEEGDTDSLSDPASNVLDALFDSVESAPAGSGRGI